MSSSKIDEHKPNVSIANRTVRLLEGLIEAKGAELKKKILCKLVKKQKI